MVGLQVELRAQLGFRGLAHVEVLLHAHEVRRQLRRGQLCAGPLAGGLAFLLEGLAHHQVHRLFARPAIHLHALVEDRVGDRAQVELHLHQAEQRIVVQVAGVGHHLLGVDRPALGEHARAQHGAQRRRELGRVPAFQVVARRAFVDAQQVDHPAVVFAQERVDLLLVPLVRNRRDGVEGLQVLVERAWRVAVRHRHAALELRHLDDFHRRVRQRDQVVLADELGGLRQRRFGIRHHLVARRAFGVGQLERSLDRLLLLVGGGRFRQRGRAGLVLQHGAGDAVHLLAHALEFALGALLDVGARQRRQQRELQLLVVQRLADAEVALRVRDQRLVQPGLVLGHGLLQAVDGGFGLRAVGFRQVLEVRGDEGVDDAEDAGVLLGDGLGMHLGHARRIQVLARLRQQRRDLLHARGGGFQAFRQRCEFARHQAVDRAAGDVVVDLRIPCPALQGFRGPDVVLQLVAQDGGVDLVLARQRGGVGGVQFGQDLLAERQALLAAGGAQVVEFAVVLVFADLGGADRRELQPAFQGALGEVGEGRIGLGGVRRGGCGVGRRGGGGSFALLAGGHRGQQGGGEQGLAHGNPVAVRRERSAQDRPKVMPVPVPFDIRLGGSTRGT